MHTKEYLKKFPGSKILTEELTIEGKTIKFTYANEYSKDEFGNPNIETAQAFFKTGNDTFVPDNYYEL